MSPPSNRDDIPSRRRHLQALDVVLGEEAEDAGALTFLELRGHVESRQLLGRAISDATLQEWWSYARRRELIAPRGQAFDGLFGLTAESRRALAARRIDESLRVAPDFRKLLREATPAGWLSLVVAAAALVSANPSTLAVIAFVSSLVLFAWLLPPLVDLALKTEVETRMNRWALRRHVAWLDGDAVGRILWRPALPAIDANDIRPLDGTPPYEPPE